MLYHCFLVGINIFDLTSNSMLFFLKKKHYWPLTFYSELEFCRIFLRLWTRYLFSLKNRVCNAISFFPVILNDLLWLRYKKKTHTHVLELKGSILVPKERHSIRHHPNVPTPAVKVWFTPMAILICHGNWTVNFSLPMVALVIPKLSCACKTKAILIQLLKIIFKKSIQIPGMRIWNKCLLNLSMSWCQISISAIPICWDLVSSIQNTIIMITKLSNKQTLPRILKIRNSQTYNKLMYTACWY